MGWMDSVKKVVKTTTPNVVLNAPDIIKETASGDPRRLARAAATIGMSESEAVKGTEHVGDQITEGTKHVGKQIAKAADKAGDVLRGALGSGGGDGGMNAAAQENLKTTTESTVAWQDVLKKKLDEAKPVTPMMATAQQADAPTLISGMTPQVTAGERAGNIAGQIGSVNTGMVQQAGTNVGEAMNLAQQAATGAAPSFAEMLLKRNAENQIKQQQAALAGRAYDPAAARNIAQKSIEIGQQAGEQAAGIRAQEMAQARGQYADIASQNRQQVMQMSMADVTNKLQALSQDQQAQVQQRAQELQASGMNAENALKASMADQATQSQVEMQNAQLRQQANLANIEADLKAKGMSQDQIQFYLSQITGLQNTRMGGAQTAMQMAQQAEQARMAAKQAQQGGLLSAGSTVLAAYLGS